MQHVIVQCSIVKHSAVQCKGAVAQRHRRTGAQGHRGTVAQGHTGAVAQGQRGAGAHEQRGTEVQEHSGKGAQRPYSQHYTLLYSNTMQLYNL